MQLVQVIVGLAVFFFVLHRVFGNKQVEAVESNALKNARQRFEKKTTRQDQAKDRGADVEWMFGLNSKKTRINETRIHLAVLCRR